MPNNENRQNDSVHAGPGAGKEMRGHGRPDHARKPGDAKRFGSKPSGSFRGRTDRKPDRAGGARNGDKPAWKRANDGKPARTPRPDGRSDWHRTEGAQDADRPHTGAERAFGADKPRMGAERMHGADKPRMGAERMHGADRPPRPGVANVHGTDRPRGDSRPFRKPGEGARGFGPGAGGRTDSRRNDSARRPGASHDPMAGLTARKVALETLLDVSGKDAYAQLALEKHLRQANLDARDTGFVTRLVYGTIENRIALDYRMDLVLEKPEELDPTVREILRMGAYQLFYMDRVPDMAATDESVRLTRVMGMEGLTGLVNGVLRNMIREKENVVWPKPEDDPVRYLSVMYSAPEALCRMLIERFGEHEALEILRFRQPKPYESIRPNLLRCDDARLRRMFADDEYVFEPGLVEGTYRVYDAGDLTRMRGYQNGLFVIQGESSVLAARAVGAKPGQTILDACAAPGGKTSLISEMMQDTGRVYAWDTHPHRVELIRGTATRLHLDNIRPIRRDAQEQRPEMAGTLDAAIIDAPCSGSGVMNIKPDLKYRITPEGVESLVGVQANILNAVADMVKPGGTLVYSTCSIFPEENERQIEAFLASHPEYSVYPLGELLPEALRPLEGAHGVQLFAHRDNIDGFYICRMIKK